MDVGLRVIDADSHVVEPPDLWVSRVAASKAMDVPRVDVHPESKHRHWRIGDSWLHPVGFFGQAGWPEYPPSSPWELEDIDPAGYDPVARLERLDEYGISAQVLYPNIIGFESMYFIQMEPELSLECTRAYNDFITEFAATDRARFVPIGMVPFWDVEAAVIEMKRCATLGHPGVLFANKYEKIGLPSFTDPYWDPIYAAAADLDLSINYHIGFSSTEIGSRLSADSMIARLDLGEAYRRPQVVHMAASAISQYEVISNLLISGVCDRFPTVKFVSVESGFGYVPYLLDLLDWSWRGMGLDRPGTMLPSEYFSRQCYGTFWFEEWSLSLLDRLPNNFMFSTDFPHVTSLSPGPASPADVPSDHVKRAFAEVPDEIAKAALFGNACKIYKLPS